MSYRSLMAAAAIVAIAIAGPALAQQHGGGPPAGAGMNSQGPANASSSGIMNASPNSVLNRITSAPTTNADTNVSTNSQATVRSQGPANASANGISHASSNSVLARGAVSSTALTGLTTGLRVNNSGGTSIGTVSQVITGSDGSIRAVVVTSPTGKTFRLPPSSLSISGNLVTTTSTIGD
jgi:hypothetical protein